MKKDIIQKIAIALVSVFIIVYCFVQVLSVYSEQLTYTQAILTEYEDTHEMTGYLLRDERVIENRISGTVYTSLEEGEKVRKGELVATVYANAGEKNIQQRILEIDEKLEILKASQIDTSFLTSNVTTLDRDIYELIQQSRQDVEENDLGYAVKNRVELLTSLNKRQIIIKTIDSFQPIIDQLEAQKTTLEATLSGELGSVYSSHSGYFSLDVDGWESIFTIDRLNNLTVEEFQQLVNGRAESTQGVIGKIFVDYEWFTLCPVDKNEAVDYTIGAEYALEFPSSSNQVFYSVLDRMITQTDSDTVILVFRSNEVMDGFRFARKQSVRVIRNRLEGLRINKEALRIVDGQQGVYVLLGNNLRFRKVEIVYTSDDYYLVRRLKSTESDYRTSLMLYDNVVLGGKNLYDGKVVD